MKKLTALMLAFVMLLSLTACGGGGGSGGTTENKDNGGDKQQTQTDNKQNTEKDNNKEDKKNFNVPKLEDGKKVTDLEIVDLKLDKKAYEVDEEIRFVLTWTGTADEYAWIGIVPADTPHGDEYTNDDADVWYTYLTSMNSGEEFMAITYLEPGKYTMRVNENDDGGAELAWVEFTVGDVKPQDNKPDTEVTGGGYVEKDGFMQLQGKLPNSVTDMVVTQLKTNKAKYEDGYEIVVTIKWTGTPSEDAWLGLFPADVPHGDEKINDGAYLTWTPLSNVEENKVTLYAWPEESGEYTIRVFENDDGGAEVAWHKVIVGDAASTGSPSAGAVAAYSIPLDGVPQEWKKAIGTEIFSMEAATGDSDFTQGWIAKFSNGTSDNYTTLKAYFDGLTYDFEADGVYNCDWGQLQLSHNSEAQEITISWYVF